MPHDSPLSGDYLNINRRSLVTGMMILTAGCNTAGSDESTSKMAIEDVYQSATEGTIEPPQNHEEVRVVENTTQQTVTVAKTVTVTNGCSHAEYTVTTDSANDRVVLQYESVDDSPDNVGCTTVIKPTPLAVDLQFTEIKPGFEIVIRGAVGNQSAEYVTTGQSTSKEIELQQE